MFLLKFGRISQRWEPYNKAFGNREKINKHKIYFFVLDIYKARHGKSLFYVSKTLSKIPLFINIQIEL